MIHEGVEFHNVAELYGDEQAGLRLQRVPETVRLHLNERAQQRMLAAAGTEIRFVTSGDRVTVTLSSDAGTELIPFFGPLQGRERIRIPDEPTDIEISLPDRLAGIDQTTRQGFHFSPDVWRLTLRGEGVRFHGIKGEGLRPPTTGELPGLRYLSYGTSITHGAAATASHLTYVAQAAWRLRADLINLGVGGSAWCEPQLADYIAGRDDYDVVSLALSVNMIGGGFTDDEFRERITYMIDRVASTHPGCPVACITIYPHFRDFTDDSEGSVRSALFRQILRESVAGLGHSNVSLIEGPDLLTYSGGLTVDLIHPGDFGMIQMGENLASRLSNLIKGRKG
jgi:lysophospholipase L1-like esterase